MSRETTDRTGPMALGGTAVLVARCAGWPLLAVLAGGVALGTMFGVLADAAALVVLVAVVVRRRRIASNRGPGGRWGVRR